jgi:hypothetical protein
MSVISTLITKTCTVHASDSFISVLQDDGSFRIDESQQSKIVRIHSLRGAMSYWGLARYDTYKWSTYDWLKEQAQHVRQNLSPEEFAQELTDNLNKRLSQMKFIKSTDAGIGIHLTAYERINDYWIPELFLISNWTDPKYNAVNSGGVHLSRETYHTIAKVQSSVDHREPSFRRFVHKHIQKDKWLIYNNGDPAMFNIVADAIHKIILLTIYRGNIRELSEIETFQYITRRPIEIVSELQRKLYQKGRQIVGGKPHDLAITPTGDFFPRTKDV